MFTYDDQQGMRDCLSDLSEAIAQRDEGSVRALMRTYKQYCAVCAQDGRFDLIQDGPLSNEAIRQSLGRAIRRGIQRKHPYPAPIIEFVMHEISLKPGILGVLHKDRPDLDHAIIEHFRMRPLELGVAMESGWSDPYLWIFELLDKRDPALIRDLIEINIPYLKEPDYNVFDVIVPRLHLLESDASVKAFFAQWEAEILKAWKHHELTDGNVCATTTISLVTRLGTDKLKQALWNPLLHRGCYQDYEPIRGIDLGLTRHDIGEWLRTGNECAAFMYCLAIENPTFDLKNLELAIKDSLKEGREWVVTAIGHAYSATEVTSAEKTLRFGEVLNSAVESLRDQPWAEKLLYKLAEIDGKHLIMQTRYGRERADLFFGQDLGL